jgi:hypothetical protein
LLLFFLSLLPFFLIFSLVFFTFERWPNMNKKKKEKKRERSHEPPLNTLRRPWPILLDGMGGCAYTFLNVEYEDKDNDWHPMISSMNMNKITPL